MSKKVVEQLTVAMWDNRGPYRTTTVQAAYLLNKRVTEVARTQYVSAPTKRTWYVVRVAFDDGTYIEARSPFKSDVDPFAAEFESRKGAIS